MYTSVILQIKEKLNQLSKSERKVGDFILSHVVETVSQNTSKLAQNIGVSPATIVCFCRSVGLSGFSQLKVKFYAESSDIDATLYTDIRPNENPDEISKKLVLRFNQSIAQIDELQDRAQVT
ncbi:MurR/RpiR family transcriptional regulator [Sporolactobacillus spathodeae]|uniref:DNA-binding MurR/RpiR family transcriptional regulator n=1 Tax=Sporolactobacillus spathodeae TaxID=1465502 RepID=A0ABS2Q7H3_9BACL|nr:MurR/RpiR family transcriptional regulator [Sporolactobacillus spathodeae]MBM7657743.1 DNA-binding MurR/RpiR family transcriptional regulator [Sporolactobacillus spathodeae]